MAILPLDVCTILPSICTILPYIVIILSIVVKSCHWEIKYYFCGVEKY